MPLRVKGGGIVYIKESSRSECASHTGGHQAHSTNRRESHRRAVTDRKRAGTWSPTRPAVIFLGMQDGTIECWDLLDRSHEAAISAIVCSSAISSMSFNTGYATDRQQMLAVGDHEGVLHITEVPSTLRRCVGRERDHMKDFFGRQEAQLLEIESRQVCCSSVCCRLGWKVFSKRVWCCTRL